MRKLSLALSLSLLFTLPGCQVIEDLISPPTEADLLERELELKRKQAQLDALQKPDEDPLPSAEATPDPNAPVSHNQNPQINVLDSILGTTLKENDTVRILIEASDADGDSLEYTWSSVYAGLSSTRGKEVVWRPGDQDLTGKTNIITVTVTDKKGGVSTASLNILVQNDGSLLVREDVANKPLINAFQAVKTTEGAILLRVAGSDPAGGRLNYRWETSSGRLNNDAVASTFWQAEGSTGDITITVTLTNEQNLSSSESFSFNRQADGRLTGSFSGSEVTFDPTQFDLPSNVLPGLETFVGRLMNFSDTEISLMDPRIGSKKVVLTADEVLADSAFSAYSELTFSHYLHDPNAPDKVYIYVSMTNGATASYNRLHLNAVLQIHPDTESFSIIETYVPNGELQGEKGYEYRSAHGTPYKMKNGKPVYYMRFYNRSADAIEFWFVDKDSPNRTLQIAPELTDILGINYYPSRDRLILHTGDKYIKQNPKIYYEINEDTGAVERLGDDKSNPNITADFSLNLDHQRKRYLTSADDSANNLRKIRIQDLTNPSYDKYLTYGNFEVVGEHFLWTLDDTYISYWLKPFRGGSNTLMLMDPNAPEVPIETKLQGSLSSGNHLRWIP